jgi:hypothetical protein
VEKQAERRKGSNRIGNLDLCTVGIHDCDDTLIDSLRIHAYFDLVRACMLITNHCDVLLI